MKDSSEEKNLSELEKPFTLPWYFSLFIQNGTLSLQMVFASILVQVFTLGMPFLYLVIFDRVFGRQNHSTLNVMTVGMILILLFDLAVKNLRSYILAYQSELIDHLSHQAFLKYLFQTPLAKFTRELSQKYQQSFQTLTKNNQAIASTIFISSLDGFFSIIVILVLFALHIPLTLISLAPLIPLVIIAIYEGLKQQQKVEQKSQSRLNEVLFGMETIHSLNLNEFWQKKFSQETKESSEKQFSNRFNQVNQGTLMQWIISLGSLATLYFGADFVLKNEITFGVYMAINMLSKNLLSTFQKLIGSIFKFRQALESNQEIQALALSELKKEEGLQVKQLSGRIKFQGVSFAYQKEQIILKDLDFEIEAGQKVVLLGKSGAGKTTILRLLQKLYQAQSGSILLDQYNLADFELDCLRKQVGLAPQKPTIFSGTIKENIALAKPEAQMKEIVDASNQASLAPVLLKLPKGFETEVNALGSNLSGGQIALISLARLFLLNPEILLFDESFNPLDPTLKSTIFGYIQRIYAEQTCIFVTDYKPIHQAADKIILLQEGSIVEEGTYLELIEAKSYYYHLYGQ